MFTLRWEVMVLTVTEVVAVSYYAAMARCGDAAVEAMSKRILDDERHHVAFQIDSLQNQFASTPRSVKVLLRACWMVLAAGATAAVAMDHGPALRACGWTRARFSRDTWRTFRQVSREALLTRRRRSAPDQIPAMSGTPA